MGSTSSYSRQEPDEMATPEAGMAHCVRVARAWDHAGYLSSLWAGAGGGAMAAGVVTRAIGGEAAAASKQPTVALADMRVAWWRERVVEASECKGSRGKSPVLDAVRALTERCGLQDSQIWRYRLSTLVEGAGQCTGREQPRTVQDLETWAERADSQVLYLTLQAAGLDCRETDHAASHIGKAAGIVRMLMNTPEMAEGRRTILPMELCAKHGLAAEDIFRLGATSAMRDVVHEVASVAHSHLTHARQLQDSVGGDARRVLLPAVPAGVYLEALEQCDFDIFNRKLSNDYLGTVPLLLQGKLWWHAIRRVL